MQPRKLTPEQHSQYMAALYSCLTYHNAPLSGAAIGAINAAEPAGLGNLSF